MKTEEEKQRERCRKRHQKFKDDPEFKKAARERAAAWRATEHGKNRGQVWRENNRERNAATFRKWYMKKQYGITVEEYDEMLARAENKCEICGVHQKDLKKKLVIDHCHDTGKLRGMLCHACNLAIGKLGDSYEKVKRATDYLKKRG